ncbi:MAG: hypothetical protein QW440_01885, partial [Saccharolobus sp.]
GLFRSKVGKPEIGGYMPMIGLIEDETTTEAKLIIPLDEMKLLLLPSRAKVIGKLGFLSTSLTNSSIVVTTDKFSSLSK